MSSGDGKVAVSNVVGGREVPAADGRTMDLVDPSTGEVFGTAPLSGPEDVDAAVRAAADAFEGWRDSTPSERQRALLRIADAIEARGEELVAAESRNTGKPVQLTLDEELPPALDQIRFFAGAARLLEGRSAGEYMKDHTSYVRREPVGVCAQVTPWNYPLMMAVWKFAPALAAGNTVVLKPSDTTPVSTVLMARIMQEFLPPGVLNVVCGDRDTGRALVGHPTPQMVSITGSIRAGREVAAAAGGQLKRTHLELGGKAPVIVFDDADLELAAEGIAGAGYFNAGQDCTAATRVLAAPRIHDDFVAALAEQARGTDDGTAGGHGRRVRAAEQRGPAGPGRRLRRPAARPRRGGRRRAPGRRPGLLLRADRGRRAAAGRRDEPGRGLRPGDLGAALRRRGRGAALGQRRRVRARVQRVDPRPRPRDADGPPARLRVRVDQHAHPASWPRCRTAASSPPATARTSRCTGWRTTPASST